MTLSRNISDDNAYTKKNTKYNTVNIFIDSFNDAAACLDDFGTLSGISLSCFDIEDPDFGDFGDCVPLSGTELLNVDFNLVRPIL